MEISLLPAQAWFWPGTAVFLFCAAIHAGPTPAGVVVHGTRVVYPADRREVTVELRNEGDAPSLVQAWIERDDAQTGEKTAGEAKDGVPFSLTPAIFRLDPKSGQSLRIIYTGRPLASDRETVFWLNVLDIPPKAPPNPNAPNHLDFAFRHRMKLFFRPGHLPGNAGDAASRILWSVRQDQAALQLVAVNPTPYHISLTRLELTGNRRSLAAAPAMLAPLTATPFALGTGLDPQNVRVHFDYIDDYGGAHSGDAPVRMEPVGN